MGLHYTARFGTIAARIVSAGLAFALILVPGASAQTVLTLQDAIDIALEKSYDMKSLRLEITQTEQNLIAARNRFKTNIRANLDAPRWSESFSQVRVPDALPVYNNIGSMNFRGGLTITQPLPTDGNLSITSNFRRTKETTYNATSDQRLKRSDFLSSLTLNFSQPLFTINQIQLDLKNAELSYENSIRTRTRRQLDIIYQVTESFFNLYQNTRSFEIARDDVDQQNKTTEVAKQKFEAGLIAEVQYLQMEVDLAEARDRLVSAEASLKRQMDSFKQLIGLLASDEISVKTEFTFEHFEIDLTKAIQEGLKNRSELREGEIQIEQLKIAVKETDAQNAISGELSAFYDLTGVSDSNLSYNTSSFDLFDSSWDDLRRRPRNRGVTFSLNVPVWDWGVNNARVKSAEARLRISEHRLDETKKTIERNITDVVTRVRDAENRIQISQRRQDLAQKTFDISLERFNIGEITADQLAQDRTRLNNAKMAFLSAFINYNLAVADLKRNTLWDFQTNSPMR
jgi:outer membrane protein TolC